MKRVLLALTATFLLLSFSTVSVFAQEQKPTISYSKGEVVKVEGQKINLAQKIREQTVQVLLLDGKEKNKIIKAIKTFSENSRASSELHTGDTIIIAKQTGNDPPYSVFDRFRLDGLLFLAIGFLIIVLVTTGRKGVGSLLGLGISLAVILSFIVPRILAGDDPLFISIIGSLFIMVTTIYLAHGFSQRTHVAVASTFISLVITGVLAVIVVNALRLTGGGSEDAYMLQFGQQAINLRGLLLGGIIIGTLGVLDDTTTTQAATVYALAEADRKLPIKTLFQKGFVVGKEHITSLVNTLVLAYAGASLPLFIFFILNPLNQPVWVILNNEMIVEEVVRTLAGSIGLVLAVPITTFLAAFFARYSLKIT